MEDIRRAVDEMARDVAAWLTRKGVFGRTVTLKLRYSDFTTLTRSHSEPRASQNADAIAARALALLDKTEAGPSARAAARASACTICRMSRRRHRRR